MEDPRPQQPYRRRAEERIAEIRRDLIVGGAYAGTAPEAWSVAEEELLDELVELELALLKEELEPSAGDDPPGVNEDNGVSRCRSRAG